MSLEWTKFKIWESVSPAEFEDSAWQDRNAVTRLAQLKAALDGMVSSRVVEEIEVPLFTFDPNQITLKKGEKVTLQLTSRDVTHGFYIRGMKIDEEIEPGKTTEITITPDKAGTFPTICDHLCGLGHKNMAMTIVVEE